MTIYRLYYVYENNGESGATRSYEIAQTTDKSIIDKIIDENHIEFVTELERGQAHVFVYNSFEPTFPEYVRDDMLKYALEADEKYRNPAEESDDE